MRTVVLGLYVVAMLTQVTGAFFVIRDAITNRNNVQSFTEKYEKLAGSNNPNNWPHFIEPVLAEWIKKENTQSNLRRFTPIAVLLLGVVLGFAGNAMALFVTS